jgi:hypothetical protein
VEVEMKVLDLQVVMEVVDIMEEVEAEVETMELALELVELAERELFNLVQMEQALQVESEDLGVKVVEIVS